MELKVYSGELLRSLVPSRERRPCFTGRSFAADRAREDRLITMGATRENGHPATTSATVGVCSELCGLFPHITVRENVVVHTAAEAEPPAGGERMGKMGGKSHQVAMVSDCLA